MKKLSQQSTQSWEDRSIMTSNISGQITFTGLEHPALRMGTSISQAEEEEKKPVRILCPQGYAFQKKVEDVKGRDYCREHCGENCTRYSAMENTAKCYWIVKESEDGK